MVENEMPGLIASSGLGALALVAGVVLALLGAISAIRRTSRGPALALVVGAAIPYLLGSIGTTLGEFGALQEIARLGPAVTPKDWAAGDRQLRRGELAAKFVGTAATILALCGAAAAVARSRP